MNAPRPDRPRMSITRAVDAAGRVWLHCNPAELHRWVSRRNELLRTIVVASRAMIVPSR